MICPYWAENEGYIFAVWMTGIHVQFTLLPQSSCSDLCRDTGIFNLAIDTTDQPKVARQSQYRNERAW